MIQHIALFFIFFFLTGCGSSSDKKTVITELSLFKLKAAALSCPDTPPSNFLNSLNQELYAAKQYISVLPGLDPGQDGFKFKSYINKNEQFIFEYYILRLNQSPELNQTIRGEIKGSSIYFELGCEELIEYSLTGNSASLEDEG